MPFSRTNNEVTVTGTETNAGFLTFCNGESDITVEAGGANEVGFKVKNVISGGIIFLISAGASLTLTDMVLDGFGYRVTPHNTNPGGIMQFGELVDGVPINGCHVTLRSIRKGLGQNGDSANITNRGIIRVYGGSVKTTGPNRTDITHRNDRSLTLVLNGCAFYRQKGQTMTSAFYSQGMETNGLPITISQFSAGFQNPTNTNLTAPIEFVNIADTGFYIWMASGRGENLRDINYKVPSSRTTALVTAKYKTSFIRGSITQAQVAFDKERTSSRDDNAELTITKEYSIVPKVVTTGGVAIEGAQIEIQETSVFNNNTETEEYTATTDANGETPELNPREWETRFADLTSSQRGLVGGTASNRHYTPTAAQFHNFTHERVIYSYLYNLNHVSSIGNAGELNAPFPFVMIDDDLITERTKATVDAITTIAIDHTASPRTITVSGAHTLDDVYDKVKADKSTSGNLSQPTYNSLAVTPVGNILDITQNSAYNLIQSTSSAALTKGSKFVGVEGNVDCGSQTLEIDVFGGTITNFKHGQANIAVRNATVGKSGETTTCTFTGATGTGQVYVLDGADLSNVTLSALSGGRKVVFVLRNGATLPQTLPTGYSKQASLEVTVNLPTGITTSNIITGLYTTDASGNYTVLLGSAGQRSYNSTDIAGLGTTITNCRFIVCGGPIIGVSRDFTIGGGVNTVQIDVVENLSFSKNAALNGPSGTDIPKTVGNVAITDIAELVTYTHRTSDNKLLIEWQGFAASNAPNCNNVLTNRALGESKNEEEYMKNFAFYGQETVRFQSQDQVLLREDRYELANGEASGEQKVTSIREIDGAGLTSDVLNIETDSGTGNELVIVLLNPTGGTAAEINSQFRATPINLTAEAQKLIANNVRDIVNTARGN